MTTQTDTAVIYDVDDESTWGYSYLAVADDGGRWWFTEDAIEQYATDVDEVDGIDWGVHIHRNGSTIEWVCYWTGGESVPVVMHKRWDVRHIDGHPYWAIPEQWRPLTDVDFVEDN